jgi:hypothetical protein
VKTDPKKPLPPPSVALEVEQYDRITRLIEKKIPVTLEFRHSKQVSGRHPGFFHRDRRTDRRQQER